MSPDPCEILYQRLLETTVRVRSAMDEGRFEDLAAFLPEHQCIMEALQTRGFSSDPGLLRVMLNMKHQCDAVIHEIEKHLNFVGDRLAALERRKRGLAAYTGAQGW